MIFKEAIKSFLAGKSRTVLTIISIIIGVMSVIIVNSVSETGKVLVNTELDNMGLNGIILATDNGDSLITQDDIINLKKIDGVKSAIPLIIKSGKYCIFNRRYSGYIYGMADSKNQVFNLTTVFGRDFTKSELKNGGDVCQIDKELAVSLFGRENVAGKSIKIYQNGLYREYQIIGTIQKESMMLDSMFGNFIPSFIYLPIAEISGTSNGFKQVAVNIDQNYNYDSVSKKVLTEVDRGKANTFSVTANDLSSQRKQLTGMMDLITLVLTAIGGISLVVSGLGIMTIMMISVNERKNEIGIKKAIGATNGRIMIGFIIESGIVAIIGGLIGSFLSVLILLTISKLSGILIVINNNVILFTIILSAVIGMIFGAYPSYKAARLRPVDALKRD